MMISAIVCACGVVAAGQVEGFVKAEGDHLALNGRPYRAVGVNVPHLHQAYMGTWHHLESLYGPPEEAKRAMVAAIDDAARAGFAFIRFFAGPGYPIEHDKLLARDPSAYWSRMDELFAVCRERGLRLVPSLGVTTWNAHVGEPRRAIVDPASKTSRANDAYVRAFVTRYKDDPTVLAWELENEVMLAADVDMKGQPLPPKGVYPPGAVVRETGERDDSLTWADAQAVYRRLAALIKELDPNHLVTSGDAGVRPEATSRRETFPDFRFRDDTWREHLANELVAQPEPLDLFSLHHYGPGDGAPNRWNLSPLDRCRLTIRAVRAARMPVFIGELGQITPSFQDDPQAAWARAYLDMAEEEGVSLIALWVWRFPWQPKLTFDAQSHPALAERAAAFNRRWGIRSGR